MVWRVELDLDALLSGLDADQRHAVTVAASPLAIIAAAGSGKTTVLTRRIAHRLSTDPAVQSPHILALTFTSQAAHELQRRLRRLGVRERLEVGTFHAVALRLLRQRALDADQRPPAVATDRLRLMTEAVRPLGGRDEPAFLLGEIDWMRARNLAPSAYATAAKRAGRRTPVSSAQIGVALDAYSTVKKRRGVCDFDDLLEQCLVAFRTDKMWAAGVRWRFRHLFVDEAQDLNPLQHALLEAIRDDRPDLCLVGDPRQAIFGFNGADPTIMENVERLYSGLTIVRLSRNYRCSPQIVAAAGSVLERIGRTDDSLSMAPEGPPISIRRHDTDAAEATSVSSMVRELAGASRAWRTCAVLARTGAQLTIVARELERLGVPTNVQGNATKSRALNAALAEAYGWRNLTDLGTWVESINAEQQSDPIRTRVAEAADRYLSQAPGITFRSWVEFHSPFDDLEDSQPSDAVDLLTFHGAKGREWRSVVIVGAETGLVPHSSAVTAEQRAEEARLLYVACTRAREQLIVTWAAQRRDRACRPSPLIETMDRDIDDGPAPPPTERVPLPGPDPIYLALVAWRGNAARAADVTPAAICSDDSLRALAQAKPTTVEAVAALTDLGPISAARLAPRLLAALNQAR